MTEKQAFVLLICYTLIWGGFALELIIWKIKRSKAMKQLLSNHIRYGIDWEFGIDCTIQIKPTFTLWLRFLCFYLTIF